jgi:hypothetical protein
MMKTEATSTAEGSISKVKLALGAASLFFFVIGLKRSFRTDDGHEFHRNATEPTDQQKQERQARPKARTRVRRAS